MTVPRPSRPHALAACLPLLCALPLGLLGGSLPAAGQAAKPPAQAKAADRLTVDQIFADGTFGRIPTQTAWSPDGRRLAYLWADDKGEALWAVDAATGKSDLLARLADLQAGAKAGESFAIDEYRWSPRGDAL